MPKQYLHVQGTYVLIILKNYLFIISTKTAFPKLWVATHFRVTKFCQVDRQRFLEIFISCRLFVKCVKILFTSYHCSQSSPLSCKVHQNLDNTWSCHTHPS